jgi:outer membrane protein OmpA-like peptidoglycan-associated protein
MKIRALYTLSLATALAVSVMAQQSPGDSQQTTTTTTTAAPQSSPTANPSSETQSTGSAPNPSDDQNLSARQPLQPDTHEGFWGKVNPFARKKYVQRQMGPVRNRVNELDELSAANAKSIKDVDARAQQGIQEASARASQADQHAVQAGNTANQANQTALQASNRLNQVEQVVGNLDQYQTASQTEIRFKSGQTALGPKAKQALDEMAASLANQKGYVIEVQGFAGSRGEAGIQSSQAMANSVVRYLVEQHNIPVYRIHMLGMGNAKVQNNVTDNAGGSTRTAGRPAPNRVEVSLLKNNLEQLASNGTAAANQRADANATAQQ